MILRGVGSAVVAPQRLEIHFTLRSAVAPIGQFADESEAPVRLTPAARPGHLSDGISASVVDADEGTFANHLTEKVQTSARIMRDETKSEWSGAFHPETILLEVRTARGELPLGIKMGGRDCDSSCHGSI